MQAVPASDPAAVHFRHEFSVLVPGEAAPLKAVADLRTHLGVPEVGVKIAVHRLPPELPGLVGALAMRGAVFGAHGAQVAA